MFMDFLLDVLSNVKTITLNLLLYFAKQNTNVTHSFLFYFVVVTTVIELGRVSSTADFRSALTPWLQYILLLRFVMRRESCNSLKAVAGLQVQEVRRVVRQRG